MGGEKDAHTVARLPLYNSPAQLSFTSAQGLTFSSAVAQWKQWWWWRHQVSHCSELPRLLWWVSLSRSLLRSPVCLSVSLFVLESVYLSSPCLRRAWHGASRWAGCCRARPRSGACSRGTPRPAGWWRGSPAAGAGAGQTCPSAAGSCTWRNPAAPRSPAPAHSPPGGSSPGSSRLWERDRERKEALNKWGTHSDESVFFGSLMAQG